MNHFINGLWALNRESNIFVKEQQQQQHNNNAIVPTDLDNK